jgi:hypothetical protein
MEIGRIHATTAPCSGIGADRAAPAPQWQLQGMPASARAIERTLELQETSCSPGRHGLQLEGHQYRRLFRTRGTHIDTQPQSDRSPGAGSAQQASAVDEAHRVEMRRRRSRTGEGQGKPDRNEREG